MMTHRPLLLRIASLVLALWTTAAVAATPDTSNASLIQEALSRSGDADAATDELRDRGQLAVDDLLQLRRDVIKQGEPVAAIDQLAAKVAGQFDAHTSGLFWHTDLDLAKAEALKRGVPIVSLRLLGRLDEELSCANSRFFRAVLYANDAIKQRLRQRFVLHWQPVVDKAPRITIAFGDGRTIERTITGNSMHWLLDANGRPVDALPGLFGPSAFRQWLDLTEPVANEVRGLEGTARTRRLNRFHRSSTAVVERRWATELRKLGVVFESDTPSDEELRNATTPERLKQLAGTFSGAVRLDGKTRRRVNSQTPRSPVAVPARDAAPLAITKMAAELPLLAATTNLSESMAADEARNGYLFHTQIRSWLSATAPTDTRAMTERIYAELFLTPLTDRNLGLAPADVFSAVGPIRSQVAETP